MDLKKILLFAGAGAMILLLVLAVGLTVFLKNSAGTTLTYWGLWEPEAIYQTAIADFKKTHPNVTIKYLKQSPQNYLERVVTALAKNDGPDIARVHNSWVPTLKNNLAPVPASVFTVATFKNTFYPVMVSDLIVNNQIWAIPLEYDGLALYVNDDILKAAGQTVPTIWDGESGFLSVARKLTVKDANNRIVTAGAAMGTASNVDHWPDILALMMLQAGDKYNADALNYYAAFATGNRTWDETLDHSTLAFANGKVAMYFGPSWRYFDIKQINPNLNFRLAPVPQLVGGTTVNYASYWVEAVSKKSPNQKLAWEFLQFISSKDELAKLYTAEAALRGFGEPYSRMDMANLLAADPVVGPYIKAAPTAKSWYLASFTGDGDTGINSRIAKYYVDAINSVVKNGDAKTALTTAASGVAQVLGGP